MTFDFRRAGGGPATLHAALDNLEVTLHNRASEIPQVHQALDHFAAGYGLARRLLAGAHLALEEHLTNIISHGYQPGQSGQITVRVRLESTQLHIEVEDDARPFNPVEGPEADTTRPMGEKALGGLGVLMIRRSVDELEYRRAGNHNVLLMKKRLL